MRPVPAQTIRDRHSLVTALTALTAPPRRTCARSFLEGLSRDELSYIADFLGARTLDPTLRSCADRQLTARCIEKFHQAAAQTSPDSSHKMILLLEYLALVELHPKSFATHGGNA